MTTTLTKRQNQVLTFIKSWSERRGYAPSLRDIAAHLRIDGTRAVEKHLAALIKKGFLKKGSGARALTLPDRAVGLSLPIVGTVTAGRPILAEENLVGFFTVDPAVARGGEHFFLRIKGDSMTGAGILDGDLALVRRQPDADSGDIVVAMIGEEATVKRLKKSARSIALVPENPKYVPIEASENEYFAVLGKVVGVFRF